MKLVLIMSIIIVLVVALFPLTSYAPEATGVLLPPFKKAVFGAGCFWEVEDVFAHVPGVVVTRVGYAGGTVPYPSYEQVCTGRTGHTEVVEVTYDTKMVSYARLLEVFFAQHDSTRQEKTQYRSVIFYLSEAQRQAVLAAIAKRPKTPPTLTAVEQAGPFYQAEEYHQHYFRKHHLTTCPAGGGE